MASPRYNKTVNMPAMGVGTITSDPMHFKDVSGIALQMTWTGTPTGTFVLEACISGLDADYCDIGVSPPAAAGAGVLTLRAFSKGDA